MQNRLTDFLLCQSIHRACSLIQNQNRRIGKYRPSYGQKLPLTLRQLHPSLLQDSVISFGQARNESIRPCNPGCLYDPLQRCILMPIGNVFSDSRCKQRRVLQHHTNARRRSRIL